MANWCFNVVGFTGEPEQIEKVHTLFYELQAKELKEGKGQLPDFISSDKGYFFQISLELGSLNFETRWTPNLDIMAEIADHFIIGFECVYQETANCIYGQAIYDDGELSDISLDFDDFLLYDYNEALEKYEFEGKFFEDDLEILEILLERKKRELCLADNKE